MLLLNFAHPLTEPQLAAVRALAREPIPGVQAVARPVGHDRPLGGEGRGPGGGGWCGSRVPGRDVPAGRKGHAGSWLGWASRRCRTSRWPNLTISVTWLKRASPPSLLPVGKGFGLT